MSGLDFTAVDAMLSRLDADAARQVRREMLSIQHGSISGSVSDKIDNEFMKKVDWKNRKTVSQSVATNSVPKTYSAPKPKPAAKPMAYTADSFVNTERPFSFLQDWSNEEIAAAVADEHPQTVTVILANLPQSQAKQILFALPPALQNKVKSRLAHYEEPPSAAIEEIEGALRERNPQRTRSNSFARLERLSGRELPLAFRCVDLQTAVIALIGMKPEFIERVTKGFSPMEEYEMRQIVKRLGNVQQKDIDEAREKIAEIMET